MRLQYKVPGLAVYRARALPTVLLLWPHGSLLSGLCLHPGAACAAFLPTELPETDTGSDLDQFPESGYFKATMAYSFWLELLS